MKLQCLFAKGMAVSESDSTVAVSKTGSRPAILFKCFYFLASTPSIWTADLGTFLFTGSGGGRRASYGLPISAIFFLLVQ